MALGWGCMPAGHDPWLWHAHVGGIGGAAQGWVGRFGMRMWGTGAAAQGWVGRDGRWGGIGAAHRSDPWGSRGRGDSLAAHPGIDDMARGDLESLRLVARDLRPYA